MNSTLIDSNVLIDLVDDESEWRSWSDAMLQLCRDRGPVVINPIIFAEVSSGFTSADLVEECGATGTTFRSFASSRRRDI